MSHQIPADERLYSRVLVACTWGSFVLMLLGFAAYLAGLLEPQVPIARLPQLWSLPAAEYLAASGIRPGWGWIEFVARGDVVNVVAAALVASIALACVAAVAVHYLARGERLLGMIAWAQVAVILLAASGLIAP